MTDRLQLPDDLLPLMASVPWRLGNLLDLRAAGDFAAGHLARSASLPLEPALLAAGPAWPDVLADGLPSIFLPPRHEPLAVIASQPELATTVAAALTSRGRATVVPVVLQPDVAAALPVSMRGVGTTSRVLWRPPAFLARWAHLLPPPVAGPVLDLGCGSGRAAVWLAERGYRVTGIDLQPDALALARRLAARQDVALDLVQADLRQAASWPAGPWAAVVCFRYLQRDLLRALPLRLAEGGVVVVRTFRDAPGFVGSPQPAHRLAAGELLRLLPAPDFTPLVHTEDFEPDGRPGAGVVAVYRPTALPGSCG